MTLHLVLTCPRIGLGNVTDRRDQTQPTLQAMRPQTACGIFQSDVGPLPPWRSEERKYNLRVMQSSSGATVS